MIKIPFKVGDIVTFSPNWGGFNKLTKTYRTSQFTVTRLTPHFDFDVWITNEEYGEHDVMSELLCKVPKCLNSK